MSDIEEDGNAEDIHLMTPPKTPEQGDDDEPFSEGDEDSAVEMDDVVEPSPAAMMVTVCPQGMAPRRRRVRRDIQTNGASPLVPMA